MAAKGQVDWIAAAIGSVGQLLSSAFPYIFGMSKADKEANEFSRQQQEDAQQYGLLQQDLTQNFNAEQAEINRDFQLQMDSTLYQRRVADMQAAGINPATMFGSGVVGGTPQGSAASTSPVGSPQASSVSPAPASLSLMNGIADFMLKMSEVKKTDAETEGLRIYNEYQPEYWENQLMLLTEQTNNFAAQSGYLLEKIKTEPVQRALDRAMITTEAAEASLIKAQFVSQGLDNKLKEQLNPLLLEEQELRNSILQVQEANEATRIQKELARIDAEIENLYAQAAKAAAEEYLAGQQADLVSEEVHTQRYYTRNAYLEGIRADIANQILKFEQKTQRFTYSVGMATNIMGSLTGGYRDIGLGTAGLGSYRNAMTPKARKEVLRQKRRGKRVYDKNGNPVNNPDGSPAVSLTDLELYDYR